MNTVTCKHASLGSSVRAGCLLLIIVISGWLNGCNSSTVNTDSVAKSAAGGGSFFPVTTPPTSLQEKRTATDHDSPAIELPATDLAINGAITDNALDTTIAPPPMPLSQPPRSTKTRSNRALSGQNSLYDRSSPAYSQLQKANQALAGFPADNSGQVDWVSALRQGKIKPRAKLRSQGEMEILTQELIMKNTREMPWVRFPHEAHTQWLACNNCHDQIFKPQQGAQKITMDDIFRGRYCGVCHDRVSFSVFTCERCHSVVHPNSPKAWWAQ